MSEAGVVTIGSGDSVLKLAHLTRTCHAYQMTAMHLAKLQHDACYLQTMCSATDAYIWFEHCKDQVIQNSPTFEFCDKILRI